MDWVGRWNVDVSMEGGGWRWWQRVRRQCIFLLDQSILQSHIKSEILHLNMCTHEQPKITKLKITYTWTCNYQVEATSSVDRRWLGKRVMQVLGHFTSYPDLLQLRYTKTSLRLPWLVGAAVAGCLALPGARRPSPAPFHAVSKVVCTHGSPATKRPDLEEDQEMGARKIERRSWMMQRGLLKWKGDISLHAQYPFY